MPVKLLFLLDLVKQSPASLTAKNAIKIRKKSAKRNG